MRGYNPSMPVIAYTTICTHKSLVAPNVYELRFTKPEGFAFKAGQFVLWDVPLIDNPKDIQPRAYSIASTPAESDLLFSIKLKEGGRASVWIEQQLKVGDSVIMKGPFGLFTVDPTSTKKLVLMATGAGIAPFRAHVKWLLEDQKSNRPVHLYFGVRNQTDFFWLDTFSALAAKHAHFHFYPCLSGDDASWIGDRGRVQQVFEKTLLDRSEMKLYVCGAPEMVSDIKKMALEKWGMEKKDLHVEGYI